MSVQTNNTTIEVGGNNNEERKEETANLNVETHSEQRRLTEVGTDESNPVPPTLSNNQALLKRLEKKFLRDLERGEKEPDQVFQIDKVYDSFIDNGKKRYIVRNANTKSLKVVDEDSVMDKKLVEVMDDFLAEREEAIKANKMKIPGVRYFAKIIEQACAKDVAN